MADVAVHTPLLPDVTIIVANAADLPLNDASVHCVVTSPPYYGLRLYDSPPVVLGGQKGCDHNWIKHSDKDIEYSVCDRCGAYLGHLGMEPLHDCLAWATGGEMCNQCYICHMRLVFQELWRVLRPDGTVWLNVGDSYAGSGKGGNPDGSKWSGFVGNKRKEVQATAVGKVVPPGLKPKDLMLVPHRLALALQVDGWWVRSETIWAKGTEEIYTYTPSGVPEPVQDRPSKAHETIWFLTKSRRYYYDWYGTREPAVSGGMRLRRDVWYMTQSGFSGGHFASFPEMLPTIAVQASSSAYVCGDCGAPYHRVLVRDRESTWQERKELGATRGSLVTGHNASLPKGVKDPMAPAQYTHLGWQPSCRCNGHFEWSNTYGGKKYEKPIRIFVQDSEGQLPVGLATVLDPFGGSGTTGLAAAKLGRNCMLVDVSPQYAQMMRERLAPATDEIRKARTFGKQTEGITDSKLDDLPMFKNSGTEDD